MFLVFCLFLPLLVQSYTFSGHLSLDYNFLGSQILDLETDTLSSELAAWGSPTTSTCQGVTIIGGNGGSFAAGTTLSRNYSSLPAHNVIYMTIDIWRIDSWDSNDNVELIIDSVSYKFYSQALGIATSNLCGSGLWNDLGVFQVIVHQNHSASTLSVKVKSNLDEWTINESVGFRNIRIMMMQTSTPEYAVVWTIGNPLPTNAKGPNCASGTYYNSTYMTCMSCDATCKNCTGPTNRDCIRCNTGFYNLTKTCSPCHSSCYDCSGGSMYNCTNCTGSYFLYPNGQCFVDCPINPVRVPVLKCNYNCTIGNYLYPNLSCGSPGCIAGFTAINVSSTGAVCNFTCGSNFYYDNGTCLSLCGGNFSSITLYGRKFCTFVCPAGRYLYQNNSCSTCNEAAFTSVQTGSERYCYSKCPSNKFYYINDSCLSTCQNPFTQRVVSIYKFCDFPCPGGQYLLTDGSCATDCTYRGFLSYVSGLEKYCNFTCGAGEMLLQDNNCSSTCPPNYARYTMLNGKFCDSSCPITQFMYLNESCLQTCDMFGFSNTSNGVLNRCNFACNQDEFLYANGTCSTICSSPYISENITVGGYCHFPCPEGTFYLQNGSCSNYCHSKFKLVNTTNGLNCDSPCEPSEYFFQNGSCLTSCPNPLLSSSFSTGQFCDFPCDNNSYYLQNGSCSSFCHPQFEIKDISVGKFCNFLCQPGLIYLQNGSCSNSCPYPFIASNFSNESLCNFPCSNSSYYYANQSCLNDCFSPFVQEQTIMGQYCHFPCGVNEYLLSNGTCTPQCPSPFLNASQGIEKYCNFPCKRDEYFHQNSSCVPSCQDPFKSTNISVGAFCNIKCNNSQYVFFDNSCVNNCSFPFGVQEISEIKYCNFLCPSYQFLNLDDSHCHSTCKSPQRVIQIPNTPFNTCVTIEEQVVIPPVVKQITTTTQAVITTSVTATAALIPFGFDPTTAAAILAIMQNFYFLLFYNVQYPEFVKNLLETFGMSLMGFLPNPVEYLIDPIPDLTAPKNFYDNNFTGFFLNTAFQCIILFFGMYGILIAAHLCNYLRRPLIVARVGKKIREYVDRSFRTRFILSIYMQTLIASFLQVIVFDFTSFVNIISYVIAMMIMWFCLGFPIFVYIYLSKKTNTYSRLKLYSALIEDYDINHPEIRIFSFYVIFKKTIHCASLVFLYYIPLLQCLIPWLTNIVMIVLMIRYKPHNRTGLNAYDLITEIGFFGTHSAVLALAYQETTGSIDSMRRDLAGYLLLGSIGIVFVFTIYNIWKENLEILTKVVKWLAKMIKKRGLKSKDLSSRELRRNNRRKKRKRHVEFVSEI